ncbi:hypothetical protein Tco_0153272 [Tanacetum coccineum]
MANLISLINDNKNGKNVQVDMAGANQHTTYTDKELDNVLDISHLKIKVGHPNGTKAFISKIGNLKLSNDLILLGHPAKPVLNALRDSLQFDNKDQTIELVMKGVARTSVLMDSVAGINDPQYDLLLLRACAERIITASAPGFCDWQWRLSTLPFAFGGLGVY